jgi:hypothetical protein
MIEVGFSRWPQNKLAWLPIEASMSEELHRSALFFVEQSLKHMIRTQTACTRMASEPLCSLQRTDHSRTELSRVQLGLPSRWQRADYLQNIIQSILPADEHAGAVCLAIA